MKGKRLNSEFIPGFSSTLDGEYCYILSQWQLNFLDQSLQLYMLKGIHASIAIKDLLKGI